MTGCAATASIDTLALPYPVLTEAQEAKLVFGALCILGSGAGSIVLYAVGLATRWC
jgi:hypothetical protein